MSDLYTEFTEHLNTPPNWWVPGGGLVKFERLTPLPGEDNINQEVPDMFGTNDMKAEDKRVYEVTVEAARETKNDKIVMLDLDVNGIKIKSCILKEETVKKDGEKYKKGDTCYFLNFPSEKVGNKYYNRVWFPVSNDCMADIIEQVKKIL